MIKNKIILLNGVSSSGKSTIGKLIQNLSDEPYLLLGIDTVFDLIPEMFKNHLPILDLALTNLHKLCASLYNDGMNLIIDHVIVRECEIKELLFMLKDSDFISIKVDCDKNVLKQREIARGNRIIGVSETQSVKIDRFVTYDLSIDTTSIEPEQNARKILNFANNDANLNQAKIKMLTQYNI